MDESASKEVLRLLFRGTGRGMVGLRSKSSSYFDWYIGDIGVPGSP